MGSYVFTVIACPIHTHVKGVDLKAIAASHHGRLSKHAADATSLHFLKDVSDGQCVNSSRKGEGLAWSGTGNNTILDGLVADLLPFFDDLWKSGAILEFEHVVLMTNPESTFKTHIAEIVSNGHENPDCTPPSSKGKRVRLSEVPWSWHQM